MKTILIITSLLFLCGAGIGVAFLSYTSPSTTEIVVLRDVTEQELAQPVAFEILGLYNLSDDNKWNGAVFDFSNVDDVSYNKISEAKIASANKWLSNELDRGREVKDFQDKVSGIITEAGKDTIGRWHSSVYLPIAYRLNALSQSKSQKKILVVYSDLMENDPSFSFYSKKEFALLQSNPDAVITFLSGWQSIQSLKGIEVYLVFRPANVEQDSQYKTVSAFYKRLLENKGAQVTIRANLLN